MNRLVAKTMPVMYRSPALLVALFLCAACSGATGDADRSAGSNVVDGEIVGTLNGIEQRWRVVPSQSDWRKYEGSINVGSVSIYGVAVEGGQLPTGSALIIGFGLTKTDVGYSAGVTEIKIIGSGGMFSSNYGGKAEVRITSIAEIGGTLAMTGGFDTVMPFRKHGDRQPDQANAMTIESATYSASLSHLR